MVGWLTQFFSPKQPLTLGDRGEELAARFLRKLGYKILLRKYRTAAGEIDIIARDGKTLVFVEVKTRTYNEPSPEEQVNQRKRRQIARLAKGYLARYRGEPPLARFDIVAIVWPEDGEAQIRHIISAFEAT
jgi:putative endonuclease